MAILLMLTDRLVTSFLITLICKAAEALKPILVGAVTTDFTPFTVNLGILKQ
jgi:hypothetical protein